MRIFDCTTYFNEPLIMDVRFNILNEYVAKFIIVESTYSHSGAKKKINFDKNLYPQFKDKIEHIIIDKEPDNILDADNAHLDIIKRTNSILRISQQRNEALKACKEASEEDYIFYSDNDEIPNFNNFNFADNQNAIIIFKQKLFYYKFNLFCDRVEWYGTKGCKKKDLISLSWLREVKGKKYPFFRFDTFFSRTKYQNVKIIENGGWHFSQLKTPEDIEIKLLNQEHHDEYRLAKKNLPNVGDLVKRKSIIYDHKAKSQDYKFSKEFKLKTLSIDHMPLFLKENIDRYSEWFDYE